MPKLSALRFSIGSRVLFMFGTLCAVLAMNGALLFVSLKSIERTSHERLSYVIDESELVAAAAENVGLMQAVIYRHILATTPSEIGLNDKTIREIDEENDRAFKAYKKFVDTAEEGRLYARVLRARQEYMGLTGRLLALSRVNRDAEAEAFATTKQVPAYEVYQGAIKEMTSYVNNEVRGIAVAMRRRIAFIRAVGNVFFIVGIILAAGTGLVVAGIARGLRHDNRFLEIEIAKRKKAEEGLRLLGTAVEQAKESILISDSELDLPGPRIIFVNPAFTAMTGYSAEEAIGKTPRILQGPRTDRAVLDRLRGNLARGETFEGETINYRKDGKEFDLEWQISPLRAPGGEVTHFVSIQRDISERRRLEAQVLQSQKLETVGRLAGGVAHQFNSILTAILGQTELLLGGLPEGSPLIRNATEIGRAAGRAATLTRQLLAYGRKQILRPETLDLNQLLADMDGLLRDLMGTGVDTRIVPGLSLHAVKADSGQIQQVIMSLAINGRDAMPGGGKLTLETANVRVDPEGVGGISELNSGDYVMLAITDSGTGMSAEVKARAFEPFYSTKGVGQGTGLGLSTCYGIVKQSGGHLSVYSEPGRGTTFKIYLPETGRPSVTPIGGLDASCLPRGTESILLVEDDPALREVASNHIRRLGYTVVAAESGREALSILDDHQFGRFDVLLTDVVMPGMSGNELAGRVRALNPDIQILFASAYPENAIVHQGILERGGALLQKPFSPSALAYKLREILDEARKPVSAG